MICLIFIHIITTMDDFVISNLHESRNEWCARLVSIFTPLITEGIRSVFNESWKICEEANDVGKYLMTFQNLLSRIPKWNENIIADERKRIEERSRCTYLEDLITCVHVIQLKILTCIRVGTKQKKVDISIPKLDNFIHKIYIHVARKVYTNVYLFEKNISPLAIQKNNRELEMIIQECILLAIRESIPTEQIIRAYLDESLEEEEEVVIENVEEPIIQKSSSHDEPSYEDSPSSKEKRDHEDSEPSVVPTIPSLSTLDSYDELSANAGNTKSNIGFNDFDSVLHMDTNEEEKINAPKSIERLEELSAERAFQRRLEEEEEELQNSIKISDDNIDLNELGILNMDGSAFKQDGFREEETISLDDLIKTF